nr:glutamate dehydrogenase isoform I, GDH I {N-terminal} {EC 1.4.1.2} [cattle, brain, Peptide Partial, 15 aa] [Bos taurus]AAB35620.1 glutamate dehydrogenase, GDH {N-terminal} [cattle, brain, Peptide Partial, 15 aa] [Bos taurus]
EEAAADREDDPNFFK